MSEANPTPGPWRLEIGMDVEAVHANGRRVNFGDAIYHPEHVADARLFVAAPELLAALKAVRAQGSHGELDGGTSVSYLVETAIAKAEGRAK